MTTRYRVEYALKTHRRDQFIEWIKALLAVPFVLNSQPTAAYDDCDGAESLENMALAARRRYAEIMRDVEHLVNDHIRQQSSLQTTSKLKMLVPSIGSFFTALRLESAFLHQDDRRSISSRRFVAPSFNDVRLILNTAQMMALIKPEAGPSPPNPITSHGSQSRLGARTSASTLQLLTFDGDVTLYDDGASLTPDNPVIPRLIDFLSKDIRIGIVTAAGYTDASKYHQRLYGLLSAIKSSTELTASQKHNLIVMGGESNFLFVFDASSEHCLSYVHRRDWILPVMHSWDEGSIQSLLSIAEEAFRICIHTLHLPAKILRKERAVGIFPHLHHHDDHDKPTDDKARLSREQLEETVLVVQRILDTSPTVQQSGIPFCAFNGGSDVFVDIGDKSLGVQACQRWFGSPGGIRPGHDRGKETEVDDRTRNRSSSSSKSDSVPPAATLHIGDQFLSGGGNDFKARLASTTAWIASPQETVALLDELMVLWQGVESEEDGGMN